MVIEQWTSLLGSLVLKGDLLMVVQHKSPAKMMKVLDCAILCLLIAAINLLNKFDICLSQDDSKELSVG